MEFAFGEFPQIDLTSNFQPLISSVKGDAFLRQPTFGEREKGKRKNNDCLTSDI